MRDISLYVLDIAENSIQAEATFLDIELKIDSETVEFRVTDNGSGMKRKTLKKATEPFFSTKGKATGLGLAFLKMRTDQCGGKLLLKSKWKKGTDVQALFPRQHIDRPPLGAMEKTLVVLLSEANVKLFFKFDFEGKRYKFDSEEFFKESNGRRYTFKLKEAENEIKRNIQTILGGVFI